MKRYLLFAFAALLCCGAFTPTTARAASISVVIGDRPYYHGPYYYRHHRRYVWIEGHWIYRHHHRHWVHGHYARRW